MNNEIRAREVRIIDENGEQLGVMPAREGWRLAQERHLDLVEVAPNADPPVCRLLDYGKFRYLQTKREREARRGRKTNEVAEVRVRPRIGTHDLDAKVRQTRKLLEEGNKVRLSVMFRGREITHPELGVSLLRGVADQLSDISKVERPPQMEGRFMVVILNPESQHQTAKASAGTGQEQDAKTEDA